MDAHFQAILDEAKAALTKVDGILNAVAGSPVTVEIEKHVPMVSSLVNGLLKVDGFVAGALGVVPEIQGALVAIETLKALGAKPGDVRTDPGYDERGRAPQE